LPTTTARPVDISGAAPFVAGLLGVMLVFLFSSLAIRAVGSAAAKIIEEVRRQFREDPGIMEGTSRPDYGRAVDITTRAALKGMMAPGLLVVGAPIVIGLVFRILYETELIKGSPAMQVTESVGAGGPESVAALLMIGTIGGVILATYFNNVGGAWDNAKKYIEAGMLKGESANPGTVEVLGKGTDAHKAAVVGDTVGDPFKDTAGPSLHVLVKLLSTVTLVLAPLFIAS
jgi:K(+)-stimulated pyrophosphate-energized sodium pump